MGIRVQTTGKNHAALRHRVKIVSLIKGIAPQQPLQRQPAALHRAVFRDRLQRILRTGRREPTPARKPRGEILLIQADEKQKHALHGVFCVSRPSLAASERAVRPDTPFFRTMSSAADIISSLVNLNFGGICISSPQNQRLRNHRFFNFIIPFSMCFVK